MTRYRTKPSRLDTDSDVVTSPKTTNQSKVVLVIGAINLFLAYYAFSALGGPDAATGSGTEIGDLAMPVRYYVLTAVSVVFGAISATFIRYPEPEVRWGARFLVCFLPGILLVLIAVVGVR